MTFTLLVLVYLVGCSVDYCLFVVNIICIAAGEGGGWRRGEGKQFIRRAKDKDRSLEGREESVPCKIIVIVR